MTDDELKAALDNEIRSSVGYFSSELSNQRQNAMERYYGELYGNEVEGRSAYVSRDVMETIEWIMPSLMRIFTGGDSIVKFEPQGPEDEQSAQQATDYINYIFQRQNDGFLTLYTFFKDALLSKNGFVKVYWEEYTENKTETYDNLSEDELAQILTSEDVEPIEYTEDAGVDPMSGAPMKTYSLKVKKTQKNGKCCVIPVPPEEILVNRYPLAPLSRNRFVAQRRRVTISELKEMGFEDVDGLTTYEDADFNSERTARYAYDQTDEPGDGSGADRYVWLAECYIKIDVDEDGVAELRKITLAGDRILENEEVDSVPFVTITPIILPHKLYGMSIADLVMDIQELKTAIIRSMLDNFYFANNGRFMALEGMANLDDLLTSRPGGIVRVKTFDAVKPIQPPLLGAPAFSLLEYVDSSIKENRTGVTRYNQGLDSNSLNKTATGISQIMSAAQMRIELIARVFAETGVKDMFYAIFENVQKHQNKAQVIRLRNEWVQVDPREWTNKFDLSVTVGLGTGSKEMQLAALNEETQFQVMALQGGLPIVTPENVYNLRMKALEAKNIKGGDLFYTHPSQIPPAPPQQDPAIAKAQMDAEVKLQLQEMKNQSATEKQAMKQEFDGMKTQFQAEMEIMLEQMRQASAQDLKAMDHISQAAESEKQREHETTASLVEHIIEKKKEEENNMRENFKQELQTIHDLIKDNTSTQNQMILKMVEATLAERETEVAERDNKGKVKKTVSRVKKKDE